MANLVILGFGNNTEDQVDCEIRINNLLLGIDECRVTTIEPQYCKIKSRKVGSKENTPYIALVYEPRDIKSGQVEEIIKKLEKGGIKLLIEYHPIPLAQSSPNLKELKIAILDNRM